uniref:Uncharacterized protein n=1 Tax=viral metagenome TaxID=1070528 RepID=A0A6M3XYR2_9ZZZZ
MEERRKDYVKIEVLEERISNFMVVTDQYRLTLCDKIDRINEGQDRIINRLDSMNTLCITREANHQALARHLEKHDEDKKLWKDRNFKILLFVMGCAWAVMFLFVQGNVNKILKNEARIEKAYGEYDG